MILIANRTQMPWIRYVFAMLSMLVCAVASSEERSFFAISDLSFDQDAEPLLDGAIKLDPKKWPSTFYSLLDGKLCTASVIGPRVVLTAEHCLGLTNEIRLDSQSATSILGDCERGSNLVAGVAHFDLAFCLLKSRREGPYEWVLVDPAPLKDYPEIFLTGFGKSGNASDGVYRGGFARVTGLPHEGNNAIIAKGNAVVNLGDSGGAAYLEIRGVRRIVAVNSMRVPYVHNGSQKFFSRLSAVYTQDAMKAFASWVEMNAQSGISTAELKICGYGQTPESCL